MRNRKDKLSGNLRIVNSFPTLYHEPWSLSISTLDPFTNFARNVSRFRYNLRYLIRPTSVTTAPMRK